MLTGSFSMIVLGLNLMVARYMLTVLGAVPETAVPKLTKNGGIIMFLGIVVVGVGIAMWKYNWELRPGDWNDVIKIGAAVVAIGAALIIRAIGYGHETEIQYGAWAAVIIGILLFIAYFVIPLVKK
jgi:hypothetical protein